MAKWKKIESSQVYQFEKNGDQIEGVLKEVTVGQYGDDYVIKCSSGEEFTLFGATALRSKMGKVKIGQDVRVTYLGEVKSKQGRLYKDYAVETKE